MSQCVCVSDFEERARKVLPKAVYDYYRSGADEQRTLHDNVEAFSRWCLVPRVLRDVSSVDMSLSVLGQKLSMPVCVASTAMQRMAHPTGRWPQPEVQYVHYTIEGGPGGVLWMQLYIYKDRELSLSLVRRAEQAGYQAIFLTVDTPYLGRRWDDVRNRFKLPSHLSYGEDSGLSVYVSKAIDPSLSWEDVLWLKAHTQLPVILKGILTEDARQAVDCGVDGILVSNHGARQLDGVPATLDVLSEVVQAVAGRCDVYLDGGVRKGTDVLKALALGAKAVFIGRPVLWGLACQGHDWTILDEPSGLIYPQPSRCPYEPPCRNRMACRVNGVRGEAC
uniref:(S)-2-hydroxy-acid oxidase n=1 Tax=Neogobius melanostomus TaxID=47308 RepID=A0A8C6WXI6_9GOBI